MASRHMIFGLIGFATVSAVALVAMTTSGAEAMVQKHDQSPANESQARGLASDIQSIINNMPDASPCDLEDAIINTLRNSGANAATEQRALSIVAGGNQVSFAVLGALMRVDLFQPDDDEGYTPGDGVTTDCIPPVPPAPPVPEPVAEPVAPAPEPAPIPPLPPAPDPILVALEEEILVQPRYTTQCEYEVVIRNLLEDSGLTQGEQRSVLGILRREGTGSLGALHAIDYISNHVPPTGYTARTGRGSSEIQLCRRREAPTGLGYRVAPPPPPPGGGNSDY